MRSGVPLRCWNATHPRKHTGTYIRDCNDITHGRWSLTGAFMPAFLFGCWWMSSAGGLRRSGAGYGLVRVRRCCMRFVYRGYPAVIRLLTGAQRSEAETIGDGSPLHPMSLPGNLDPAWMVGLSTAFAVIFRQGLRRYASMNVFSPALLTRLRLLRLRAFYVGRGRMVLGAGR